MYIPELRDLHQLVHRRQEQMYRHFFGTTVQPYAYSKGHWDWYRIDGVDTVVHIEQEDADWITPLYYGSNAALMYYASKCPNFEDRLYRATRLADDVFLWNAAEQVWRRYCFIKAHRDK